MVMVMSNLVRILALFFAFLPSAVQSYSCPEYERIATSRVAANEFSLEDFIGEWYMIATSEPTLPSLCTCPVLKWFVDNDGATPVSRDVSGNSGTLAGAIKQYHYTLVAECAGVNFSATMKGEARDPQHPGSLTENMEVFNHSVAPYVPHMIYDVQTMPDGNVVGFTYACLLGHTSGVNMFSFNVVARKPTLTPEHVKALVAKQNERTGGVFNVDGIRYSDSSVCGWNMQPITV